MINSTNFLTKFKSVNNSFTTTDNQELKAIQQKYPYFQLGAMLLSKSLLKTKDLEYKTTLTKTAIIVNDRERLFNYLYKDILTKEELTVDKTTKSPTPLPKESEKEETKIKSTSKIEAPKPIKNSKGEEIKNKKEMMEEVSKNLTTDAKSKAPILDIKIEVKTPTKSKSDTKPASKVKAKTSKKKEETKAKLENKEDTASTIVVKKKQEEKPTTKKLVKDSATKKKNVIAKSATIKETVKPTKTVAKKTKSKENKQKTTSKTTNTQVKSIDRKKSIEIIEKFIKEDPSINKPEDKAYIKELQLAKASVSEKYDIVSETMAKLYKAQGNKKKAKKIYEKLILIYPEKSTYFAARISDL